MNKKIVEALNSDLALELSAITQYMWHHVMATGLESPHIQQKFKEISIVEMKHAEAIANRITYLGGTPTTKPAEIRVGGDLKKMIKDDLKGERIAIKQYTEHVRLCDEEGDFVTKRMLEKIIADEQEHDDFWSSVLDIKTLGEEGL